MITDITKGMEMDKAENESAINDSLALKIFTETCCNGCSCKSEKDHEK